MDWWAIILLGGGSWLGGALTSFSWWYKRDKENSKERAVALATAQDADKAANELGAELEAVQAEVNRQDREIALLKQAAALRDKACDDKHRVVDQDRREIFVRMNGMDKKLSAICTKLQIQTDPD